MVLVFSASSAGGAASSSRRLPGRLCGGAGLLLPGGPGPELQGPGDPADPPLPHLHLHLHGVGVFLFCFIV